MIEASRPSPGRIQINFGDGEVEIPISLEEARGLILALAPIAGCHVYRGEWNFDWEAGVNVRETALYFYEDRLLRLPPPPKETVLLPAAVEALPLPRHTVYCAYCSVEIREDGSCDCSPEAPAPPRRYDLSFW